MNDEEAQLVETVRAFIDRDVKLFMTSSVVNYSRTGAPADVHDVDHVNQLPVAYLDGRIPERRCMASHQRAFTTPSNALVRA